MCFIRSTKTVHALGSENSRNGSEMPEMGRLPAKTMMSMRPSHCVGIE
jgi:hypothetical protein